MLTRGIAKYKTENTPDGLFFGKPTLSELDAVKLGHLDLNPPAIIELRQHTVASQTTQALPTTSALLDAHCDMTWLDGPVISSGSEDPFHGDWPFW